MKNKKTVHLSALLHIPQRQITDLIKPAHVTAVQNHFLCKHDKIQSHTFVCNLLIAQNVCWGGVARVKLVTHWIKKNKKKTSSDVLENMYSCISVCIIGLQVLFWLTWIKIMHNPHYVIFSLCVCVCEGEVLEVGGGCMGVIHLLPLSRTYGNLSSLTLSRQVFYTHPTIFQVQHSLSF